MDDEMSRVYKYLDTWIAKESMIRTQALYIESLMVWDAAERKDVANLGTFVDDYINQGWHDFLWRQ